MGDTPRADGADLTCEEPPSSGRKGQHRDECVARRDAAGTEERLAVRHVVPEPGRSASLQAQVPTCFGSHAPGYVTLLDVP